MISVDVIIIIIIISINCGNTRIQILSTDVISSMLVTYITTVRDVATGEGEGVVGWSPHPDEFGALPRHGTSH